MAGMWRLTPEQTQLLLRNGFDAFNAQGPFGLQVRIDKMGIGSVSLTVGICDAHGEMMVELGHAKMRKGQTMTISGVRDAFDIKAAIGTP